MKNHSNVTLAEDDRNAVRVLGAFERSGIVEPLSLDPGETSLWQNCELASLVENRFARMIDPFFLDPLERAEWVRLTSHATGGLSSPHSGYSRPYWMVDAGVRIGTIAVATFLTGRRTLNVSSLFVVPEKRGQGLARRTLEATYHAALAAGLSGINLSTEWSWQQAVRFYLAIGMWVRGWKRCLEFVWCDGLPTWQLEVDRDVARFVVLRGSRSFVLIETRREGKRLRWTDLGQSWKKGLIDREALHLAPGTFAAGLAVQGWPLITNEHAWQEQLTRGWSDFGGPEGLAFKIRTFEAWDRKNGWCVDTPRIPGLDYPDWDAL